MIMKKSKKNRSSIMPAWSTCHKLQVAIHSQVINCMNNQVSFQAAPKFYLAARFDPILERPVNERV